MYNLKNYLRTICELEKERYFLKQLSIKEEQSKNDYNDQIRSLTMEQINLLDKYSKNKEYKNTIEKQNNVYLWLKRIIYILGILFSLYLFFMLIPYTSNPFEAISATIIPISIIILVILYIIKWFRKEDIKNIDKLEATQSQILIQLDKISENYDILEQKIKICEDNIVTINDSLYRTTNLLINYYNLDIIYSKYQNFPIVCKLLEYIESNRCLQLSGPNGAYDTYEKESRMDITIEKMDIVIQNLSSIEQHNIVLYNCMNDVKNTLENTSNSISSLTNIGMNICSQLKNLNSSFYAVQKLNEITAYNTSQIRKLENYQSFAIQQKRIEEGQWN